MADLLASLQSGRDGEMDSRATSPGPGTHDVALDQDLKSITRSRPRTYPYSRYLPYETESTAQQRSYLDEVLKQLYISIETGDFAVGAVHWTRALKSWLELKFDLTKDQRIRLVPLYYELSLAPGIDPTAGEKFASTFTTLLK